MADIVDTAVSDGEAQEGWEDDTMETGAGAVAARPTMEFDDGTGWDDEDVNADETQGSQPHPGHTATPADEEIARLEEVGMCECVCAICVCDVSPRDCATADGTTE